MWEKMGNMALDNDAMTGQSETEIPGISKIERFRRDGEPIARVWFDNGGAIQYRDQNGQVNEEYILPSDQDSVYESFPLGSGTEGVYEVLITLLSDLNDYNSVEHLENDMPDAMLETFGVELE
jgi:hypothetical protein